VIQGNQSLVCTIASDMECMHLAGVAKSIVRVVRVVHSLLPVDLSVDK